MSSTYAVVSEYTINPVYLAEHAFVGAGIDMRDPIRPMLAPGLATWTTTETVRAAPQPARFGLETSAATVVDSFIYRTAQSVQEEQQIIKEHFRATYGLSHGQQQGQFERQESHETCTTYVLVQHTGETRMLEHPHQWDAATPPDVDDGPQVSLDEVRERFFERYGTHYVSQVTYGLRVGIQATMTRDATHTSATLEASVKAAFGSFGAEGGISVDKKKALNDLGVEVRGEVSSGGVEHRGLVILNGLDAVEKYLIELRDARTSYAVAPVSLVLKAYAPTLKSSWRVYEALKTTVPEPPDLEYGVPLGTVVAWYPPSRYVEGLRPAGASDYGSTTVTPPKGWVICDGTVGTPDLTQRFVRGIPTGQWQGTSVAGGSPPRGAVTLTSGQGPQGPGISPGVGSSTHRPSGQGHTHTVDLPTQEWPPFVDLVYIMRMA